MILDAHDSSVEMKDSVVRGRVLELLYDRRGENYIPFGAAPDAAPAPEGIDRGDWLRAVAQLAEYGLIDWTPVEDKSGMGLLEGFARINQAGLNVLKGSEAQIDIRFEQSHDVSSSRKAMSTTSTQRGIAEAFEKIIAALDQSNAPEVEKRRTKGLLRKILESNIAASLCGEEAQSLLARYFK
jgi:hypothetical protein